MWWHDGRYMYYRSNPSCINQWTNFFVCIHWWQVILTSAVHAPLAQSDAAICLICKLQIANETQICKLSRISPRTDKEELQDLEKETLRTTSDRNGMFFMVKFQLCFVCFKDILHPYTGASQKKNTLWKSSFISVIYFKPLISQSGSEHLFN